MGENSITLKGEISITIDIYQDRDTNELKQGKTISLDSEDMAIHSEALEMLQTFIEDCKEQIPGGGL